MRVVSTLVRMAVGGLVLAYEVVTSLPHLHAQPNVTAVTAAAASPSPPHRCLQCSVPSGQALTPEHSSLLHRVEPAGSLPRVDHRALRDVILNPGRQRAPPA